MSFNESKFKDLITKEDYREAERSIQSDYSICAFQALSIAVSIPNYESNFLSFLAHLIQSPAVLSAMQILYLVKALIKRGDCTLFDQFLEYKLNMDISGIKDLLILFCLEKPEFFKCLLHRRNSDMVTFRDYYREKIFVVLISNQKSKGLVIFLHEESDEQRLYEFVSKLLSANVHLLEVVMEMSRFEDCILLSTLIDRQILKDFNDVSIQSMVQRDLKLLEKWSGTNCEMELYILNVLNWLLLQEKMCQHTLSYLLQYSYDHFPNSSKIRLGINSLIFKILNEIKFDRNYYKCQDNNTLGLLLQDPRCSFSISAFASGYLATDNLDTLNILLDRLFQEAVNANDILELNILCKKAICYYIEDVHSSKYLTVPEIVTILHTKMTVFLSHHFFRPTVWYVSEPHFTIEANNIMLELLSGCFLELLSTNRASVHIEYMRDYFWKKNSIVCDCQTCGNNIKIMIESVLTFNSLTSKLIEMIVSSKPTNNQDLKDLLKIVGCHAVNKIDIVSQERIEESLYLPLAHFLQSDNDKIYICNILDIASMISDFRLNEKERLYQTPITIEKMYAFKKHLEQLFRLMFVLEGCAKLQRSTSAIASQ